MKLVSGIAYISYRNTAWEGKGRRVQKRGHLQFSDCFEGGNIGKVVVCRPKQEYTIWLRADTANDRFRLWFNFTVRFSTPFRFS